MGNSISMMRLRFISSGKQNDIHGSTSSNIELSNLSLDDIGDEEQPTSFTCEICIEAAIPLDRKFKNVKDLCSHPFCVDCIIKYIQVKVVDERAATVKCPGLGCGSDLDPLSCRWVLPAGLFKSWSDVLCEHAILGQDVCYCPNRRCGEPIVNECGGGPKRSVCPNCKHVYCFKCKIAWHGDFVSCDGIRDANDAAFVVLAREQKWVRCPKCRHCIQRVNGCNKVTCRCKTSFCYTCGKEMQNHVCGKCNLRPMVVFIGLWIMIFIVLLIGIPVFSYLLNIISGIESLTILNYLFHF